MTQSPGPFRFPASHRLSGTLQFAAVFDGKCRKSVGPLTLVARPNALPHNRLGCSVSRRVGTAVKRNRIKRLLREAYRLDQHELPRSYDLVVIVHPHDTLSLDEYRTMLAGACRMVHQEWQRRQRRQKPPHDSGRVEP